MKVKELIEILSKEDPEKRIVVNGYEGGFDELDKTFHVCITPNPDKTKNDKFLLNNKDDVLIMYRTLLKIIP
jgi:hypothetical protein